MGCERLENEPKLKLAKFEIGNTYLCEDNIGKKTIGWTRAEIVEINDKYIFALIFNGKCYKVVKFSRLTGKEFRPYLRHYRIIELVIDEKEVKQK